MAPDKVSEEDLRRLLVLCPVTIVSQAADVNAAYFLFEHLRDHVGHLAGRDFDGQCVVPILEELDRIEWVLALHAKSEGDNLQLDIIRHQFDAAGILVGGDILRRDATVVLEEARREHYFVHEAVLFRSRRRRRCTRPRAGLRLAEVEYSMVCRTVSNWWSNACDQIVVNKRMDGNVSTRVYTG